MISVKEGKQVGIELYKDLLLLLLQKLTFILFKPFVPDKFVKMLK